MSTHLTMTEMLAGVGLHPTAQVRVDEHAQAGLPPRPSTGVQVTAVFSPSGPGYAFVECDAGVYWVFRSTMFGRDEYDSAVCFSGVREATEDAAHDWLLKGVQPAQFGEQLRRMARGGVAA